MLDYRCYFLDVEGHIRTRREFEAKDDAEGILLARGLYAVYAECAAVASRFRTLAAEPARRRRKSRDNAGTELDLEH